MAPDVVRAGWRNGLEPSKADAFMGVSQGFFQQSIDDGRLGIKRMREPGFATVIGVVTYGDIAQLGVRLTRSATVKSSQPRQT